MLVLSRKRNERIVIGEGEITVEVLKICGNKVNLGIEAPPEVMINRQEVFDNLKQHGKKKGWKRKNGR